MANLKYKHTHVHILMLLEHILTAVNWRKKKRGPQLYSIEVGLTVNYIHHMTEEL